MLTAAGAAPIPAPRRFHRQQVVAWGAPARSCPRPTRRGRRRTAAHRQCARSGGPPADAVQQSASFFDPPIRPQSQIKDGDALFCDGRRKVFLGGHPIAPKTTSANAASASS